MLIRIAEPESDWVYSSEDYLAGELLTHSQSAIWLCGFSDLAGALLSGVDPHSALAATVLGVSYEEFLKHKKEPKYKNARQTSKPFNFGKIGGMGDSKLVLQQRKQGDDTPAPNGPVMVEANGTLVPGYRGMRFCILMNGAEHCGVRTVMSWGKRSRPIPPTCEECLQCAAHLGEIWKRQWRENKPYFEFVSNAVERGMLITAEALERWPHLKEVYHPWQQLDPGQIMQHISGRIRNVNNFSEESEGSPFCAAANGFFQSCLAEAARLSHMIASRECYDSTVRVPDMLFANSIRSEFAGGPSPLYGSKIPVFLHDELLCEHRRSIAHEGATRISEIMRDVLRHFCPDLAPAVKAEPTLMKKWRKGAECVRDANGRLIPWEPAVNT